MYSILIYYLLEPTMMSVLLLLVLLLLFSLSYNILNQMLEILSFYF